MIKIEMEVTMIQNLALVVLGVVDAVGIAFFVWVGYAVWRLRIYGLSRPLGIANG